MMNILLIDDNPFDRTLVVRELRKEFGEIAVIEVSNPEQLESAVATARFEVVITDYQLQWTTGIEVLKRIKARDPELPVIMFTGTGNEIVAVEAMKAGLDDYVIKSAKHYVRLPVSIRQAVEKRRLRREAREAAATIAHLHSHRELILRSVADGIIGTDHQGRHTFVNQAALEMLGYQADELIGRDSHKLWHHSRRDGSPYPAADCPVHAAIDKGETSRGKDFFWRRDGSGFVAEFSSSPVEEGGRNIGAVLVFRDVTEQDRVYEALRRAEHEWEHTFNSISDFVSVHDRNYCFVKVNKALADFLGKKPEELIGRHCHEIFHGLAHCWPTCPHREALMLGTAVSREVNDDKIGCPLQITASPIYDDQGEVVATVHIARDLTAAKKAESERQALQAQLFQAQKMECVGQLAGGIAHDFNNYLSTIIGFSDLILFKPTDIPSIIEKIKQIRHAGERSANLVRQLLAFSRKQILEMEPVVLDTLIERLQKMTNRLLRENIAVHYALHGGQQPVMADPTQIEQILLNLVVNARDAMPEGGTLTIRTAAIRLDETTTDNLPAGDYQELTVADTGTGIADEIKPRIFEPFFTTKAKGEGTGLGLATVYGIVAQHQGRISFESHIGPGTTFRILLPRAKSGQERSGQDDRLPAGGNERILVVEDDPLTGEMIRDSLAAMGYEVLAAANGEEGLRVFGEHEKKDGIDLVLTDVFMPGMSGPEMVEQIKRRNPALKALFMSGYSDERLARQGIVEQTAHFLGKPLTLRKLADKVRLVLDEATGGVDNGKDL